MPQSLGCIVVHVVFSTKHRARLLTADIRPDLHAYMATVVRGTGCECYRVGGVEDHVHLAIRLHREVTTANLVRILKTASSKWLKAQSPALAEFRWQRGYAVFSVGREGVDRLLRYIDNQEAHHQRRSFKNEYRAVLSAHEVEWDERYVWD
jgi:REP element-mobilizing transposase RayT